MLYPAELRGRAGLRRGSDGKSQHVSHLTQPRKLPQPDQYLNQSRRRGRSHRGKRLWAAGL